MSRFSLFLVTSAAILFGILFLSFPVWTSFVLCWLVAVAVLLRALEVAALRDREVR